MLHSQSISELIAKIEKTVLSCHKIENSLGNLLDKTAIIQFAGSILQIIAEHIKDEEQLTLIADSVENLIT